MKKITAITLSVIMLFAVSLCIIKTVSIDSGCNISYKAAASNRKGDVPEENDEYLEADSIAYSAEQVLNSSKTVTDDANISSDRKLTKSISITAETLDFDKATAALQSKVNELGGYIENSSVSGNSYNSDLLRSAQFTIRIPADKCDSFTDSVSGVFNITSKNESVNDETDSYTDTESHLKALRAEEKSLLALLKKADKVETVIALQSQLTDVIYEIENYERMLRSIDKRVAYSCITVDVSEVERETKVNASQRSWGQKLGDSFKDAFSSLGEGFKNFCITFVGILPQLILVVIVALIVLRIISVSVKRFRRKRTDKIKAESDDRVGDNHDENKNDISAD